MFLLAYLYDIEIGIIGQPHQGSHCCFIQHFYLVRLALNRL